MTVYLIVGLSICLGLVAGLIYFTSAKARARRDSRKLALSVRDAEQLLSWMDQVPNKLVARELRKGLVLTLQYHIEQLESLQPRHPHLWYLQSRLQRLNKIPSGFERTGIRSREDRRQASVAFEALGEAMRKAGRRKILSVKQAHLAAAAATFAGQQIAVETARQAAKDAENVRAYRQALNFAYQAQALCGRLPPLMGDALRNTVSADVERLETLLARTART